MRAVPTKRKTRISLTPKELATLCIASYAAILATVTLFWNIRNYRKDAAHLRVSLQVSYTKTNEVGATSTMSFGSSGSMPVIPSGNIPFISVDVTNVGRRPITIHGWATFYESESRVVYAGSMGMNPQPTLAESASFRITIEDFDKFRSDMNGFAVLDTHGQHWHAPTEQVEGLKRFMLQNKL